MATAQQPKPEDLAALAAALHAQDAITALFESQHLPRPGKRPIVPFRQAIDRGNP